MVLCGYTFTRFFIKEWAESGKLRIRRFLNKRFSKLTPALLIVIGFNIAMKIILDHPFSFSQVISVMTYTTNYYNAFNGHPNNGLAHLWTLSMIMQFYILWPFLFLYLIKKSNSLFDINRYLSFLIAAVIIYRSTLVIFDLAPKAYIYNAFETRFDCFLIGAFFAFNIEHHFMQKIRSLVLKYKWSIFLVVLSIASMTIIPTIFRNTIGFDLHSILIGVLIVQLGAIDMSSSIPSYSESLGEVTYWFYLLHPWGDSIGRHLKMNPYAQVFFGGTILLMAITLLCYFKNSYQLKGFKTKST